MGFLPEETIYKLVFDDPSMAELEVRARSVPLGPLMDVMVLADRVDVTAVRRFTAEDRANVNQLFSDFLDHLVEWNLERRTKDGGVEPVPMTLEGVRSQDITLMMRIVKGWIGAASGVSAPLDDSSTSGDPSLEESLPMEPLSESPSSLPTPV